MELNICVCDDDGVAVGMITGALSGILEKKGVRADISAYRDVRALEEDMRLKAFDLILLDIDMPGTDGIEFARRLREERNAAEILFVSGCENRVFESFRVEPLGFVRKNRFLKDLMVYVDAFLKKHGRKEVRTITVTHNKSILRLSVDEIVYIEGALKKQRIFTSDAEYVLSSSMKQAEEDLAPLGFIRIHSGYLVNYRYIKLIDIRDVVLTDGRRLPVSRSRVKEAREKFFAFMRESGSLKL